METGPLNLITDIDGILVGNSQDETLLSGVTMLRADPNKINPQMVAAGEISGGAPGTRETDLLNPSCMIEGVHALVLAGGSAFGLGAADGVVDQLNQEGIGFNIGTASVPIVTSAILFDLLNGGDKAGLSAAHYAKLGAKACQNAGREFALGNVGAGLGAKAGWLNNDTPLKGGLGSASLIHKGDNISFSAGALVAVNSFGSPLMAGGPHFWGWPFEQEKGEYGGLGAPKSINPDDLYKMPPNLIPPKGAKDHSGQNTTLAVVATDLALTKAEAKRVAIQAHDGLARAIYPLHTPFDGDSVFVLSTGKVKPQNGLYDLLTLSMMAANCLSRAVCRGVYEAKSAGNMTGYNDLF